MGNFKKNKWHGQGLIFVFIEKPAFLDIFNEFVSKDEAFGTFRLNYPN